MNTSPRVLWLNPWDKRIGPNRYLADMLAADRALAENAIIVLPCDDAAAAEYRALGCTVEIWDWATLVHLERSRANLARVLRTHTRGVQFARARLRELRPDVVITNSENVWFAGMAARSLGIPHLQVFHALTLEHRGNRPWLVQGYLNWLGLWSRAFVGVSSAVVEMLTRNGVPATRALLVPNGLNLDAVRAAATAPLPSELEASLQARLQGRGPVLVTLGRISALKGHDLLIQALPRVRAKFPHMLCLLAGAVLSDEGIEDTQAFYAALEQQIAALGLKDNILFLGEIDYAPALLKRADVYVQPSRSESFCRAVVEAMACGIPVAAFRAGALAQVVGNGGLLAPPQDVNALADAILCLLEDETVRAQIVSDGQAHVNAFEVRHSVAALYRALDAVRN